LWPINTKILHIKLSKNKLYFVPLLVNFVAWIENEN